MSRAIESVASQSRASDRIIVVHEDGDKIQLPTELNRVHVSINQRSRSLSGAINHAIDEIVLNRLNWNLTPNETWLALLDDDDWWEETYLEKCSRLVVSGIQQVVSGITRYDSRNPDGFPLSIPEKLDVSSFLISNPHIQGSNMFVRLDSFLEAGGFDESLYSCTDRDFCIRLFERPNHQWTSIQEHLVNHDARGSGRISDFGSPRKLQGLQRFSVKHQYRMDDATWEKFLLVADERFGFNIDYTSPDNDKETEDKRDDSIVERLDKIEIGESFDLTIAVTIGELGLVKDFANHVVEISSLWPGKLRLVVCLHKLSNRDIDSILAPLKISGIEVITHGEKYGRKLADKGLLGPWFISEKNRHGASWGRCVLHRAALDSVLDDRRPAIWIVDDDMSLCEGIWSFERRNTEAGIDSLLAAISFMHNRGIDVGVGHIIGDPPLPTAFTQRTQFLDLYYGQLMRENPERRRVRCVEIDPLDIHHDLANNRWDHLEFPMLEYGEIENLDAAIGSIISGKAVTREVHGEWSEVKFDNPIVRGGNTLVLDPNVLNEWPNVAPNCAGIQFRRGDSLWATWAQRIMGLNVGKEHRRVGWIPFAIPQRRRLNPSFSPKIEHIRGDILGSMFLREIQSIFKVGSMQENRRFFDSSDWFGDIGEITVLSARKREARLISSMFRTRQLAEMLGYEKSQIPMLENFWTSEFSNNIDTDLKEFCYSFSRDIMSFRSSQPKFRPGHIVESAWQIYLDYGGTKEAEIVGQGSEGVIFKEGGRATKIFHEWITLEENLALLEVLVERNEKVECLPNRMNIEQFESRFILTYDWVEGIHPLKQISSRPWLELLTECRENGIVFWNIKPENVVLNEEGKLVCVDVGRDLKMFTEQDWYSMARKAYICWKHWEREDIQFLLSRSIRESDPAKFSELQGIDSFHSSMEILDKSELHDPWLLGIISLQPSGKLLDWGCGTGRLSEAMANLGHDVDAFDPDYSFKEQIYLRSGVNWLDSPDSIVRFSYDIVTANLVLCVIEDHKEVVSVFSTLKRALKEDGRAFVTVCHPLCISTQCSTVIERPEIELESDFVSYEKFVRSTGRYRIEHTRSIDLIEKLANEAGLIVVGQYDSPGLDVDTCKAISEFVAIELTHSE